MRVCAVFSMMHLYDHPKYYTIAFSFRDIQQEVNVFEECIRRYSKIPVQRVLELGSGDSPHMEELARRGYEYVGLDTSAAMLDYARQKAKELGITSSFVQADMRRFSLEKPIDFVYVMLDSLYVETTEDLVSHFESVADALNPGGLYFLDWCIKFEWSELSTLEHSWTIEKDGVKVDFRFVPEGVVDRASQIYKNRLIADVDDHGKRLHLESEEVRRIIFPQEFLMLVENSKAFEFIAWGNNWNLDEPIEKATQVDRPITLIRRI